MFPMVTGFQVKDLGGKGNGLVATADFPRGTRIISETPHLWFTTTQPLSSTASMLGVGEGSQLITKTTQELESAIPHYIKRQLNGDRPGTLGSSRLHENGDDFPDQTPEQFASANILPAKNSSGCAMMVYYLNTIGHINHACFPNAEYSWNDKLQLGIVHAVCDIKAGDEVTINYGFEMYQCRSYHIRERFGFICLCDTCERETSLPRDSDSGVHLRLRDEQVALLNEKFLITNPSSCRKYHPETCLRKLYWQYQYFKKRGYQDSRVNKILMEAFQILAGHGDLARALHFAERYLEAQIACYGRDADEIEKWKGMVKDPITYVEELFSEKWRKSEDQIPTDPATDMDAWMWRRKAGGEVLSEAIIVLPVYCRLVTKVIAPLEGV
ncbi:SET domain-containing protein [Stipitochalara longipes BDJ]|nr:SET domain-containing protein [Stipitochalara longipes BDJ]